MKLVEVDYDNAEATFAYDPDARPLKDARPEQVRERIDHLLRVASRGGFSALLAEHLAGRSPARDPDRRGRPRLQGCAFGPYRAVAKLDGVERATVDFSEGS